MPQNTQTTIPGRFIPDQASPSKPPLLLRLGLPALVVTAIVLIPHTSDNSPDSTRPPAPTADTRTPASDSADVQQR
ncbi:hypothetical protein [Streptomyces aureoverticillatus]|uniref:hypothetical protein n=1 Tax=Streptomyces aureoverticillatus TaxID=66871 RepID=UPI0013DB41A8|nr:hypothetical protein [Streptomyces aureoverticillatus]QIB49506.1 hypothetical protein G3H79_40765 [Streptomyces aureoverticillatus]